MNLKEIKIITVLSTFFLSFLTHFSYQLMPNIITAIFFPVNESIFEHMKMIYSTVLIINIIELFIIKKNNLIVYNKLFNLVITGLINIVVFLLMYLPIFYTIGEKMVITIILLFISIVITQIISYYLLKHKKISNKILPIILLVLIYSGFIYYTYNPIHNDFFYDPEHEVYGIYKS